MPRLEIYAHHIEKGGVQATPLASHSEEAA